MMFMIAVVVLRDPLRVLEQREIVPPDTHVGCGRAGEGCETDYRDHGQSAAGPRCRGHASPTSQTRATAMPIMER